MAHTQFGPETALVSKTLARNTSARKYFGPLIYFGPENASARLYTSARKYFGPIDFGLLHFGPGTKLSKVSCFIIFDLP